MNVFLKEELEKESLDDFTVGNNRRSEHFR